MAFFGQVTFFMFLGRDRYGNRRSQGRGQSRHDDGDDDDDGSEDQGKNCAALWIRWNNF